MKKTMILVLALALLLSAAALSETKTIDVITGDNTVMVNLPELKESDVDANSQSNVNPLPTAEPTDVPAPVTPDPGEIPELPGEPQPTVNPLPTAEPTATPTAEPTATPTAEPTATPTAEPTATPTAEPTAAPTAEPTATPTAEPTATPTAEPTATPTAEPTAMPTAVPTDAPAPVTPAPDEEPVLTAEPQPTVNPLPTGTPECTHDYETIIDSVSSKLVYKNDRQHSVRVVCHDRCTFCGEETASRRDTILEAHDFSDKGHIEAAHQSGLGHAYYDLCACGAAKYTGDYGNLDSCSMCKPATISFTNLSDGAFVTAGEDLHVSWTPVDGIDHYEFAARYIDETEQCVKGSSVGLNTQAVVPSVKYNKTLQLWVGAFANSEDLYPLCSVIIQVKTTEKNDAGGGLSNSTIDDPNYYYSNEFIAFDKDAPVREGYIRFVSQIPSYIDPMDKCPAVFDAEQWIYRDDDGRIIYDRSDEAGGLCSYAALSMQLSYLGIDCTPGKMFKILKGGEFNRTEIINYLVEHEGANIDAERKGLNNNTLTKETLDSMLTSYEKGSSYSPVLLFMEYGSGWNKTHAVLVIGRSGNKYYLANPETRTGMGSFEVEVKDGIMYIKNASSEKYNGRRISTITQTWKND